MPGTEPNLAGDSMLGAGTTETDQMLMVMPTEDQEDRSYQESMHRINQKFHEMAQDIKRIRT